MKKMFFSFLAVCIFIFLFSVSSFAANEAEPNNSQSSATDISVDSPVTGNIENDSDSDWYRFQVPADGVVTFTLSHQVLSSTDIFWKVAVFQSDGVTSAATSAQIEWTNVGNKDLQTSQLGLRAGTYYVRVAPYKYYSYNTCQYSLKVNFTASGVFEKEKNESPESATPVSVNTAYKGAVSNDSDKDWYKFSLDSDGSISISLSHDNIPSTDIFWKFSLYNGDGVTAVCGVSLLEWYVRGNANYTTSKIGLPKGTYYVCVQPYKYSSYNTGTYSLSVDFEAGDDYEKENNGNYSTANLISVNKTYYGSITHSDEKDMYKFTVPSQGKISVSLTHNVLSSTETYWRIFIYGSDGVSYITGAEISWEVTGNSNRTTSEIGVPPGDYYIKIEACRYNKHSTETYGIRVDFSESQIYEKEVNGSSAKATPVKLMTDYKGASANTNDADWYAFDVSGTTEATVVFSHDTLDSSDTVWYLNAYSSDGVSKVKEEVGVPGNKTAYFSLGTLNPGKYYLKVTPSSRRHNSSTYTIRINGAHTCSGVWNVTVEPQCEKTGKRQKLCSMCGALMTEEDVPEKGHTFNEWNIIKPADCDTVGEREAVCVDCGFKKNEDIPKTAHNFSEWKEISAATCTEAGERISTCSICDTRQVEEIPKKDHEFGEWIILSEADCENAGKKEHICGVCEFVETEEITAAGHVYTEEKIIKGNVFIPPLLKERTCDVCASIDTYEDWSYVWVTVLLGIGAFGLCGLLFILISSCYHKAQEKKRRKAEEKVKIEKIKEINKTKSETKTKPYKKSVSITVAEGAITEPSDTGGKLTE